MDEKTVVKTAIAAFWLGLLASAGLVGVFVWGMIELVLWIGRH